MLANNMWYVYILEGLASKYTYVGSTNDLKRRIFQHNNGSVKATKNYVPFRLKAYIVVESKSKAIELEQYLKSGSGRAFLHKRVL